MQQNAKTRLPYARPTADFYPFFPRDILTTSNEVDGNDNSEGDLKDW